MGDTTQISGEFCWNELVTTDTAGSKLFYAALLKWDTKDLHIDDTTYTIFSTKEKDVAGMMQSPSHKSSLPARWLSYIKVDDLAHIIENALQLGATLTVPIKELAKYGRFAVIQDPQGAYLAFWEKTE